MSLFRRRKPLYVSLYSNGKPVSESKKLDPGGHVYFSTPNGDIKISSAVWEDIKGESRWLTMDTGGRNA